MNDNQADILLWNAFKQGDRGAFDSLFRKYHPLLLQYGFKLCPEKELLEDCIQELFIEVWQSRTITQVQSVKAYLLKALKYKLYKLLRTGKTLKPVTAVEDDMNFELSHDHFIMDREERIQSTRQMTQAVNRLPNRQREIVYLKIYQGLSYEEISEVMGINYQVSRNLFYQSIKSLRQFISEV